MTNEEAKRAYNEKAHVWFDGSQYDYIYARKIKRDADGKTNIMVLELLDMNQHSLVEARMDKVSLEPPKKQEKEGDEK